MEENNLLNATFFVANRERLGTLFTGTAPIILTAHGIMQHAGDSTYPFKQDSNFWYLTGIEEPDVILVIDKGKEFLIVPEREATRRAFDGAVDKSKLSALSGISEILDENEGWKRLAARLKKVKTVATLAAPPAYIDTFGFYTNPARSVLINRLRDNNPNLELLDLRQHLAMMRMVKQPSEIAAIQQAIDITGETIKDIRRKRETYAFEYEIEAALSFGFRKRGAKGHAFSPIVAAGSNASVIHYTNNNAPIKQRDLLLLDVGADVSNYAADITRTIARFEPTKRQRKIYEAVREVQDYAYELLRPGISIRAYEKNIEHFMGEKLRSLGLIKVVEHEFIRHYYPHATSHFLGLDVHDAGDYDRMLEPGVVLTVEPGIYIPEEGIGVRIEDDVLITESGIDILTKKITRDL